MAKETRAKKPAAEKLEENPQQSGKRGKTSSARKNAATRHGTSPAPETSPHGGASGRADEKRARGELRNIGGPGSELMPPEEDEDEDEDDTP